MKLERTQVETWAGRIGLGLLLFALLVAMAKIVLHLGRPFTNYGDQAIFELDVIRVLGGEQLVGVYSRFGWRHPGPAFAYLVTPVWWLAGRLTRGLFLGSYLINAVSAAGIVLVVRRFAAGAVALGTAGLVAAYLAALDLEFLAHPWNPLVLAVPMGLLYVLVAACTTGSIPALVGAFALGSYAVQTHIGTGPTVAVVLLLALVLFGLAKRRHTPDPQTQDRRRRALPVLVVVVLLGLIWAPPIVEELTSRPGNLTELYRFFVRGEGNVEPVQTNVRVAVNHTIGQTSVFPLGTDEEFDASQRNPRRRALAYLLWLGAAAVAALGLLRGQRFAAALGAVSFVATTVAVLALTRVSGPLFSHLVFWMSSLPIPAWIGGGILVRQALSPWWAKIGSKITVALAVPASVAAAALALSFVQHSGLPYPHSVVGEEVTHSLDAEMRRRGVSRIRIEFAEEELWPQVAGAIVELTKAGYDVTVDDDIAAAFEDRRAPRHPPDIDLLVLRDAAPEQDGIIVQIGDLVIREVDAQSTNNSFGAVRASKGRARR